MKPCIVSTQDGHCHNHIGKQVFIVSVCGSPSVLSKSPTGSSVGSASSASMSSHGTSKTQDIDSHVETMLPTCIACTT